VGIDLAATWNAFNTFLESNVFKIVLVPLAIVLYKVGGYFGKRRTEGAGDTQQFDRLHAAADLREKLTRQNATIGDLKQFIDQALDKPAQSAVVTAQYYINRAEFLALSNDGTGEHALPEAETQADLTHQAAGRFAMAEDELAQLLKERLATFSEGDATEFLKAQEAWRAWRSAEADWEAKIWEGGSIQSLMVTTKLESLTRERIASIHVAGNLEGEANYVVVPYRKTPRDLPEHLMPGVTSAHVRSILGPPDFISDNYWQYRFQETRLELIFDGEVIQEATFAMVEGERYEGSLGVFGDFTFGQLTFGELQEEHPEITIEHRTSMRTLDAYTSIYVGLPGAYQKVYLGALIPHHGSNLMHSEMDWNFEANEPAGFPKDTIINWFGVTGNYDHAPGASWLIR
jgi:uncharacterized protein YecT (DUF1311 family)